MTNLKFFYNGIKVNGQLHKAWFSFSVDIYGQEGITIYKDGYKKFPAEIRAEFEVKNESDSQTDYFESDHIRVLPDHPLFKTILKDAVVKDKNRALKQADKKQNWNLVHAYIADLLMIEEMIGDTK